MKAFRSDPVTDLAPGEAASSRVPGGARPSIPAVLLLSLPLALAGCGGGEEGGAASGPEIAVEGDRGVAGETAGRWVAEGGGLHFDLPSRWGDSVTVRETVPAAMEWVPPAPDRVFQFVMTPVEERFAPENLFNLYLFSAERWEEAQRIEGPPVGRALREVGGRVLVVSEPLGNPYPRGTADHDRFERFRPSEEEVVERTGG